MQKIEEMLDLFTTVGLADILRDAQISSSGTKRVRIEKTRDAILDGTIDFDRDIVNNALKARLIHMCKIAGISADGLVQDLKLALAEWFETRYRREPNTPAVRQAAESPTIPAMPSQTTASQLSSRPAAEREFLMVVSEQEDEGFLNIVKQGFTALASLGAAKPLRVTARHAEQQFQFDPGHPRVGVLYIRSPYNSTYYLPIDSAARQIARLRQSALVAIAGALGAKRLEILNVEVTDKRTNVDLSSTAKQIDLEGKVGIHGEILDRLAFTWQTPKRSPVPENLLPFLKEMPEMVMLYEMVTHNQILSMGLVNIEFREEEDIIARLGGWLSRLGLAGYGSTASVVSSKWTFRIDFTS